MQSMSFFKCHLLFEKTYEHTKTNLFKVFYVGYLVVC